MLRTYRNNSELTSGVDWDKFIEVSKERMGSGHGSLEAFDLGVVLLEYCRATVDDKDPASALDHHKLMLELIPLENVDKRLKVLNNFGAINLYHFQKYHTAQYVNDAIDCLQEAILLNTAIKSTAFRYETFSNLGMASWLISVQGWINHFGSKTRSDRNITDKLLCFPWREAGPGMGSVSPCSTLVSTEGR